jgi:hypothetical protein
VAVKFDLWNSAGEGNNSTGLYVDGASPTVPATTFTGGVNLHSGDVFLVTMTYNGTTLSMTVTDQTTPADTFTTSWTINIPATVGGNTAYVGFTGGSGGLTATQQIISWVFSSGGTTTSPAATPVITPATGTYTSAQTVSIIDSTSGAAIYYTLNDTTPSTSSTLYTAPFPVSSTTTVEAIATATGFSPSGTATSVITIPSGSGGVNFGSGFSATGMQLNGTAVLVGTALQLTSATETKEAGSAFWTTPVNVEAFTNTFMFQLTNEVADGFTFTIQNAGLTALGPDGGGLGYGPSVVGGGAGIATSVAVKFDLFNNNGEGNNSTGLYVDGASPTVPATTFTGGVNLHS